MLTDTQFSRIQRQFLCCVPAKKIQWQDALDTIEWHDQKRLVDETVALAVLRRFPIQRRYIVQFLRFIVESLERQSIDIHDDLYTRLCEAQSQPDDDYSFKHYRIDSNTARESIVLKENRNKISQGTTGLNVWESAMAMAELAINRKELFAGKNVVELGAGIGFSGISIGTYCAPNRITITDGNEKVLSILSENVGNNFEKINDCRFLHGRTGAIVEIASLDWMSDNSKFIMDQLGDTDLIIGADIIYDNSLFRDLLTTVKCLFDHCKNIAEFLLMNAVRNVDTETEFLGLLDSFGLTYREEVPPTPAHFYWQANEHSPIKLYAISPKTR